MCQDTLLTFSSFPVSARRPCNGSAVPLIMHVEPTKFHSVLDDATTKTHETHDPPQDAVGQMTSVEKARGRCEHWIKPEHQTCVKNVGASQTLFLIGGEYYKQGEKTTHYDQT